MEVASSNKLVRFAGAAVAIWGLATAVSIFSMPSEGRQIHWVSLCCGFSFLLICTVSFLGNPQRGTRVLAVVGLGCSLIFLTGPGFESQLVGAIFSVFRSGLVLVGFAAMLHFLLLFPEPGPFAASSGKIRALYIPAFLFWLLLSTRALFPATTGGVLDTFTYVLTGLITAGYLLAGLIVFLRKYIRTAKELRGLKGLRLMLWGSLAGFLPAFLSYTPLLSRVPGKQFFFISLALLPLVWTQAASIAATE